MNLTRTNYRINTINPNGNEISIAADYTSPASYDKAAIAENKEFESIYELDAGETLIGKTIYITGGSLNIGNAYPSGTPTSGYRYTVTAASANNTVYLVPYIGCANNGANNEMFKVTIEFTNIGTAYPETFTVKVQQILGFDIENYRACDFYDNQTRLLKSKPSDASNLLASANTDSFYNNASKILVNIIHVTEGTDYFRDEIQVPFQACWYNKGLLNAAPYFSAPTVALEVNGVTATGLSPIKNTKVTLTNDCPVSPDHLVVTLIDVSNNNQAVTWWENYDYSAAEIVTDSSTDAISGYNSKFMSPSQLPTLTSGSTYEMFFEIDGTQLVKGNKYRIIWTLYNLDPYYLLDDEVNTFISDEFTCDFYEPFSGVEFELTGKLSDYQREYLGNNLEVIPEERIKAILDLEYWNGVDNSLADTLGSRFIGNGSGTMTAIAGDIRSSLKSVNILLYYAEIVAGQTYIHDVADVTIIRTGLNTYLLPDGTEFEATGTDASFPAFQQACRLAYEFRVRYEADILNLRTYIAGVLQPQPLGSQDWTNKTIYIKWTLDFEYELMAPVEYDTVYFTHQIRVKDYENKRAEIDRNLDFLSVDDELQVLCDTDPFCPVSTIINLTDDYKHIVNLDRASYKVQNIKEEEVWTGVLDQLTTDELTDVDENYIYDTADFCVDLELLNKNVNYKVAAIAKKEVPCTDGIEFTVEGTGETIPIVLKSQVGKDCVIHWGDGTTTSAPGTGANQSYSHAYSDGSYDGFICGDVDYLTVISFGSTGVQSMLKMIDLSNFCQTLLVAEAISVGRHENLIYFNPPTALTSCNLVQFGTSGALPMTSSTLHRINIRTIEKIGTLGISGYINLSMLELHPSLVMDGSLSTSGFKIENTALNKVFDFDLAVNPSNVNMYYYNDDITNVMTVAVLDENISNIYDGRANFDASIAKVFDLSQNNPAPSGTYQAPAGYIQANGVTVGNDGSPASAKEQIYVLQNQNNDNTVVKKYNWTFTTN